MLIILPYALGSERGSAMRFRKGSKVEIWTRRQVPCGSWWSAEIIYVNGHTCTARYDGYPTDSNVAVDRVPRKAIRPCPLQLDEVKEFRIGDVAEVFDDYSWKLAEAKKIIERDYCVVMLLGSFREFQVHKSHIRRQLSWHNNKWMVIQKVTFSLFLAFNFG